MIDRNASNTHPKEHDSQWPLVLGVVWALLLHLLMWPIIVKGVSITVLRPADFDLVEINHKQSEPDNQIHVGENDLTVPQVAWISYEDYQKLVAPQRETEQPAVQTDVTPVPDAPLIIDATEPAIQSPEDATNQVEMTQTEEQMQPEPEVAKQDYELPVNAEEKVQVAVVQAADTKNQGQNSQQPNKQQGNAPQTQVGAVQSDARPTSTPRDESESPATSNKTKRIIDSVRPGAVLTYGDVKVKTKVPRFGIEAILTTLRTAGNPSAQIEFNPQGEVISVKMTKKTGAANIDGPVLSSLYSWKASGAGLDKYKSVFLEVTILLR